MFTGFNYDAMFPKDMQNFFQLHIQAMNDFMENYNKDPDANWKNLLNVTHIYQKWASELMCKPTAIWEAQYQAAQDSIQFWSQFQNQLFQSDISKPFLQPDLKDKRFLSPEWKENPLFNFYEQFYLLFSKHCLDFVKQNPSQDPKVAKQVLFFTRLILDALSPTNYVLTNPDVLKHTWDTQGKNLIEGYKHFLEDCLRGQGHWNIKMTDISAFEVGENLAVTPGKVVYQNRLIQLIQYTPTTEQVVERPLLMVPPWINKYYILDLKEKNSLVKWIVDQGVTVYMISWVNPDKSYKETTFADYMQEGVIEALNAIQEDSGQETINTLGFCIGGTLLATTLGYLKAKNSKLIESATFLTTLIDFSEPGDVDVFIDEEQISTLEARMEFEGYLDGRVLMATFNYLRSNDLLWPYYINNYLCGKNPFPFDLLYWNCDSTNLPYKMHSFYLRNMYLENRLVQPGKLEILDVKIDLSKVKTPAYFLSTEQDHISPWETTFWGAKALGSDVTFVLGGSGHIAGVVNPPSNQKYGYRYNEIHFKNCHTIEEWLEKAAHEEGSWWNHWMQWLKKYSGETTIARIPGESKLQIIQDAPGDYVKKHIF